MKISKRATYLILFLILIMQLVLRLPFLGEPLNGDEGIYSYFAMRLNEGDLLYRDIIDVKPPMVYYFYLFIFKFFGQTAFSLRAFTAFFGLFTTLVIFLAGRRLLNNQFGLVSAFLFALFSGGPLIEGAGSNTEVFMILPMVLALYCFLIAEERPWMFLLAGLFSGLAVMVKQVAFFNFLALLGFCLFEIRNPKSFDRSLTTRSEIRTLIYLLLGFLIFPLLSVLYFWSKGILPDFMNATLLYGTKNISFDAIVLLFRTAYIMLFENSVLWVLAAVAIFYIWLRERNSDLQLLTLWGLFSLIGVFVGGYVLSHYFIQVMPALCLLSGVTIVKWPEFGRLKNYLWMILLILGVIIVIGQYEFYLVYTPEQISIAKYGAPVNVIAREIGEKIKERTAENDYIFPRLLYQILFYARRNSLSRYYLSHGGFYRIVAADGKILYSFKHRAERDPELARKESEDFYQALHDRRTKYFIFMQDFAPKDIFQMLADYRFDKELSYPEHGILVYKRIE